MIHVFGHKNPDSDSICSALVITDWLNGQGRQATHGVWVTCAPKPVLFWSRLASANPSS